jgi:hypothetical protein
VHEFGFRDSCHEFSILTLPKLKPAETIDQKRHKKK